MAPLSLLQLYEEKDTHTPEFRVIIGGATLPKWTSIQYQFAIGEVPTATITVPSRAYLPAAVAEEASVQIWFGLRWGIVLQEQMVFGGAVVDSVSSQGPEVIIKCVMSGPRKLVYSYNRRIDFDFDNVTAVEAVTALLDLAGVSNYYVDLEAWLIGTAVPHTALLGNQLQFSSYGEAVNKVSEVDGSPWYALPTGQVRVEKRDPIPSASWRRTYFTGLLTGIIESQPTGVTNASARPRIVDISRDKFRNEVANFIEVDGAVVTTIGPLGEQNSSQIVETVDGASGQFPNGAYWIPTPPLFQDFTFSNELIDTNAKAFEVAERYFDLKNRLLEKIPLTVPGDPDVFLGETVKVIDPRYSGVQSLYFVDGYSTAIDSGGCVTQLSLSGGPESGTTGFAAPFAEFIWKYQALHDLTPGGWDNTSQNNQQSDPASKLCEDLPSDTGSPDQGGNFTPGSDRRTVIIGLDGTPSEDFDGQVVSYDWYWVDPDAGTPTVITGAAPTYPISYTNHLTGPRQTMIFDPDIVSSVSMTLLVTDDSGRVSKIVKTIYTSASYIDPGTGLPANDPTLNDTDNGGGQNNGPCCDPAVDDCGPPPGPTNPPGGGGNDSSGSNPSGTNPGNCNGMGVGYFVAAGAFAMGTTDNRTWNDLAPGDAGASGDFISVAAGINYVNQKSLGIFGTSTGDVVITDDICVTGTKVFNAGAAVNCIVIDGNEMGDAIQGANWDGTIPIYTQGSPGTMTILEAYHQALKVGFTPSTAVLATAVMMAESGLVSNASNSAGNNPPSTDRGIVQINDYYHPEVSDVCAYNTECAIIAMFKISGGGSDFSPWAAYNAGTYKQFLSQIQDATGTTIDPNAPPGPGTTTTKKSFKVWLGTTAGLIFVSTDSGQTWKLWGNAGHAIHQIITPSFPPVPGAPSLWVFGGDTGDIHSLILRAIGDGRLGNIIIGGFLKNAIDLAPGNHIQSAVFNDTCLAIGFSGGVDAAVWVNSDPIGSPEDWEPAINFGVNARSLAKDFGSGLIGADATDIYTTIDDVNFTDVGLLSNVNEIVWQGLPGKYIAIANNGLYTSPDNGVTWGALRPNAVFGTTWPVGAIGYQVAFAVGPNGGNACNTVGMETVAAGESSSGFSVNWQPYQQYLAGKPSASPGLGLIGVYQKGSISASSVSGGSLIDTINNGVDRLDLFGIDLPGGAGSEVMSLSIGGSGSDIGAFATKIPGVTLADIIQMDEAVGSSAVLAPFANSGNITYMLGGASNDPGGFTPDTDFHFPEWFNDTANNPPVGYQLQSGTVMIAHSIKLSEADTPGLSGAAMVIALEINKF